MSDGAKTFLLAAAAPVFFFALLPLAAVQAGRSESAVTSIPSEPGTECGSAPEISTKVVSAHRQPEGRGFNWDSFSRLDREGTVPSVVFWPNRQLGPSLGSTGLMQTRMDSLSATETPDSPRQQFANGFRVLQAEAMAYCSLR